jgi:hypothetical protein
MFLHMKPIRTLLCAALLCITGATALHAQQYRLVGSPNYPYFLDNIYDLRNGATAALPNPVGLAQFVPAAAGGARGISIHRYNPANGQVLTQDFNYISAPGTPFSNLRGTKFTEAFGSYFSSGTVLSGGLERIFLLKTATAAPGNVITARYLTLPANALRPTVSNIIVENDFAVYVSGTLTYNNRLCVFALRTDQNLGGIGWFRIYPLAGREFSTFAQCLVRDGGNGLVIGGLDQTNARAVVLRVNPANGNLLFAPNAFSLCISNNVGCTRINRVSLGLSGAVRDMVVQTSGNVQFNVSQMNASWTLPVVGTTHRSPGWDIRSVRFEPTGVLISHLEPPTPPSTALFYTRSRYAAANGAAVAGTAFRYQPPTLDLLGILNGERQIETISLSFYNNRIFSVGKYRHNGDIRTLAELQPSAQGCQVPFTLATSPERLFQRAETLTPVIIQPGNLTLPVTRINGYAQPVFLCSAANIPDGDVNGRDEEPDETALTAAPNALLSVFPNPFSESLTLSLADGGVAEAMLLDMTGKLLIQQQFGGTEPTESLSAPSLPSGIYLLRVRDGSDQWHYRKVLKE